MIKISTAFWKNVFTFVLGKEQLNYYDTLNWEQAILPFKNQKLIYPNYYKISNFHGIEQGYLNKIAPITYDLITRWASPPNEKMIRQQMIKAIVGQPQNILDLGCGTGSTTLNLKQTFPQAQVTGLDLSPYMLWMADHKAQKQKAKIKWRHGLAEATEFAEQSFDLITIAMVFHETPPLISQQILQECRRLLVTGGQLIILDGHQRKLRNLNWLIKLFREPYSRVYAAGDINQWLQNAGFSKIETKSIGWINQLSTAHISCEA